MDSSGFNQYGFDENNFFDPDHVNPQATFPPDDYSFGLRMPHGALFDEIKEEENRAANGIYSDSATAGVPAFEIMDGTNNQFGNSIQGQQSMGLPDEFSDLQDLQNFVGNQGNSYNGTGFGQDYGMSEVPVEIANDAPVNGNIDVNDMSFLKGNSALDYGMEGLIENWPNNPEQFQFEQPPTNLPEQSNEQIDPSLRNAMGAQGYDIDDELIDAQLRWDDDLPAEANNNIQQRLEPEPELHFSNIEEESLFVERPPPIFHPMAPTTPVVGQRNMAATFTPTNGNFRTGQVFSSQQQNGGHQAQRRTHNGVIDSSSQPSTPRAATINSNSPSTVSTTPRNHVVQQKTSFDSPLEPRGMKRPPPEINPQCGRRFKKTKTHNPVNDVADLELYDLVQGIKNGRYHKGELKFGDIESVKTTLARAEALYAKPRGDCTAPGNKPGEDPTFPKSSHDWQLFVRMIMEAIMDWTMYIEWMQVVDKGTKEKRANELVEKIEAHERNKKDSKYPSRTAENALSTSDLVPPDTIQLPTIEKQQSEVLGRHCNNFTAECLAWKLVEAAIDSQQGRARNQPWTTNDGA